MSPRNHYAELHAHSAFTFLESPDLPHTLVRQSAELGLSGIGILDVDGMYSAVKAAQAGRELAHPIIHGTELTLKGMDVENSCSPVSATRLRVFGGSKQGSVAQTAADSITRGPSGAVPPRTARPEAEHAVPRYTETHTVRIEKGVGLPAGSEDPGLRLPVLAMSQDGYHNLCSLLSTHFLAEPGRREASLTIEEIATVITQSEVQYHGASDLFALTGTRRGPLRRAIRTHGLKAGREVLEILKDLFGQDRVGVELSLQPHESPEVSDQLVTLAAESRLPLVATGAVRVSAPANQPLADVLTATRLNMSLDEAEPHLSAWRTFIRTPEEMHQLHSRHPEGIDNAVQLAKDCAFDLRLIEPGLPSFEVPDGYTEATWLRHLTYQGALHHYGSEAQNPEAWALINHELRIIEKLDFPGYFLIVKDIVDFCCNESILCQGRGSAANSAVCYALGITAVDAVKHKMLFERFLSPDRKEPPDIDLDIEANERERAIQYVYKKYGRENAAQVANVITYRPKSAVRDAGRALGHPEGVVRKWTKYVRRSPIDRDADNQDATGQDHSSGMSSSAKRGSQEVPSEVLEIAQQLQRLPRHMGLHPGGMVLTRTPVSKVCPVMWAAKKDRTVLQWDKEDCADAGLVKFDLLGLGMLTALRRVYTWLEQDGVLWNDRPLNLHNLPAEDPRVYDLLCAADTVGVFQVESRAQMNTLPRLQPRTFYDIVIEVALIRPGPIQGNAVSPYLRRKRGREEVTYPHELMKPALEKTLGVPLFQEQLMQIAVDVAGFTPSQADQLRRAIGSKRSGDRMKALRPTLFKGMTEKGVRLQVQEQIFDQLKGFAEFGFPESHAFSFAYLVYASAWLKVHYPEYFYAGILASQPMGFYSSSSLVADARRHGIVVLPPSVVYSAVSTEVQRHPRDFHPESHPTVVTSRLVDADPSKGVRLGLETVKGLGDAADRICKARQQGSWKSLPDLASRACLAEGHIEKLASAGALVDLGIERREGLWAASVVGSAQWEQPYLPGTEPGAIAPKLPEMNQVERLRLDFTTMGLSVERHPMETVREQLKNHGVLSLIELMNAPIGKSVRIGGVVTHRQRPATARGTTFLSLEDETGLANVICSPGLWERYRKIALESEAMVIRGRVEKGDGSVAVVADKLEMLRLGTPMYSRDFR